MLWSQSTKSVLPFLPDRIMFDYFRSYRREHCYRKEILGILPRNKRDIVVALNWPNFLFRMIYIACAKSTHGKKQET